jgi:hypothetical protein
MPYQQPSSVGLNLKDPPNITKTIEFDPVSKEYVFKEKVGKMDYNVPYALDQKEYSQFDSKNSNRSYWIEKRKFDKGQGSASFMPKLNLGGEAFDKIFGSNTINIVPQGSAELIFGLNTQRTENPAINESLRKTTTFDFQEKIQMNVTGTIGDKMKLGINYNTEATFDFENKTKLEYTGKEDEIIKKIEAGNVTMPLGGTLITGSQNLFGIKTELQFGKLTVTSVVSQQKGQSSVIDVKGGAQISQFDIPVDQYDANKHFFLSQFFRNKYEDALKRPPTISSGVVITKIEVWVTNKVSNYTDARNYVAFLDLGESKTWNQGKAFSVPGQPSYSTPTDNGTNGLYATYSKESGYRDIKNIANILTKYSGFVGGDDYEVVESARKLTDRDFTLNPKLGYISLNTALNNNEVLAVAYEYTYEGKTHQVGEFSSINTNSSEALILKMLKNSGFTPRLPNWDLMMKNVYSINAFQVSASNFQLNIFYQDDKNGTGVNYIPEDSTSTEILLEKLKLDRVNSAGELKPDGVFDFIEGVTITATNGHIFFPTLEPFGKTMEEYLVGQKKMSLSKAQKYIFKELYANTQTSAKQIAEKDKYRLKGTYQSAGGSDIPLNAMNVPQGSVVVTAGGRKLTENMDYTVDYALGRVKIINSGLLESGTPIRVSLESNSLFNFQTKTLVGTHLDYKFSDNFHLGGTVMNLTERPLTTKVNIGDEPISNTIWGLNGTYTTKSQFLTKLVDKIPFLNVKEPSTVTVDGEFAQLIPGHSKAIDKAGTAYIDDFEGSETTIDLKTAFSWTLASTPSGDDFSEASHSNQLDYGYNRAKLAWYQIDPLFLRNTYATPANIKGNKKIQSSPFVMEVFEKDIFKNVDEVAGVPTNIPVLNLAYYPTERGPYNYSTNVDPHGYLKIDPTHKVKTWGGIQREITQSDFETANIQYIEFWMMDPYVLDGVNDNTRTEKDGALYFNLGDVSEDVLKDSRKSFENGLPTTTAVEGVDSTVWGYVAKKQAITEGFALAGRKYQDVGLDGLGDEGERRYWSFQKYLTDLKTKITDTTALGEALRDPSSDDYRYFKDSYYDIHNVDILGRYKNYNGMEGNSPENNSSSGESTSATILPNSEDINRDNTLSEKENYFHYKISLAKDSDNFEVGKNYIVDKVTQNITYTDKDGTDKPVTVSWYQFRVPISSYDKTVGSISDFQNIHFMRMYLSGFDSALILRFAKLDLVRGEWRRYTETLRQAGAITANSAANNATFEISAVNIEQNSGRAHVNYVLPPGVSRQTDPSNPQIKLLNEQSMSLKVSDLSNGDAKAAYKGINFDLRQYKHLKMYVHAEKMAENDILDNDELTLFLRLGSDYTDNFYEYEIPLKITPYGSYVNSNDLHRSIVWPDSNQVNISLSDLQLVKQLRNDKVNEAGSTFQTSNVFPYSFPNQSGKYYIRGNPNLSNVKTIMIGVRYPLNSKQSTEKRSAEVWVDELRVTDFNEQGGWAANLRLTSKLSDFGTIAISGNTSTPGFGSIDKKVNERSKEYVYQYDIASNLELGKFFKEKSGVQIPMFVGYSKSIINPQYDPLDPDVELSTSLKSLGSDSARQRRKSIVQDWTEHYSVNFTNVRINKKDGKPHFYDISNWTVNYGFNQTYHRNINTEKNLQRHFQGGLMYNFQPKAKNIAPFQNWKIFRPNSLKLIRDFNFQLIPTTLSFRTDMSRNYNELKLRNINNLDNPKFLIKPTVNKDWFWNRYYDVGWDLTKSIKIDFTASNVARIDEIDGVVNRSQRREYRMWRDSVWQKILQGGRVTHYQHDLNVTYNIPINKLPLMAWTSANARYTVNYDWDAGQIAYPTLGNTITNSNQLQLSGQLNFMQLYNKVPYFKKVTQPPQPKAQQQKKYKTITFQLEKTSLTANEPRGIFHGLGTKDVKVKVLDVTGKEIKGKTDVLNENKVTLTVDKSYTDVKITVEGKVEDKPGPWVFIRDNVTRLMLAVKNINISWSRNQGTRLPGFMPKSKLMGMSDGAFQYAPGWDFVFGVQDKNFAQRAVKNHWMTTDSLMNDPMIMLYTDRLSLRSTLEPFPGFRIELNASRSFTKNQTSYYSVANNSFENNQQSGNFSISFVSIGSAFERLQKSNNYHSHAFDVFNKNRNIIANRLATRLQGISGDSYNPMQPDFTSNGVNGYGYTSQDVMIPAFMAAYGGISANNVTLDRFPSALHMLPNWRINYDGLSKVGFLQNVTKSISLSHSYTCTYNVGNYLSNLEYTLPDYLDLQRDMQNNFIPEITASSVSINEQFGPLIGVDVTFVNSLSTKFEIRKSRILNLSLSNNQLTETNSDELVAGAGYKIPDFKFILKDIAGGQKSYKSDLNLRADLSIRDNKTILRRFTEEGDQPSSGQKVLTLKVSADYLISDKFTFQMFYSRIVNSPIVNLTYPTSTTDFGFSLRFSLAQ